MLSHKIIKQSDTEAEFEVSLDQAYIKPHKTHVLEHLRSGVKVAGFRPGKAPDNVVERELGAQKVQGEVLEDLIVHSYSEALKALKFETIAEPQITLQKFVPYTEIVYRAKVVLVPKVKLPDLIKLNLKQKTEKVSDKEITEALDQLRRASADRKIVERAAKMGDQVKLDFEGKREGKPVEGAAAQNQFIELGTGRFIPGFEEAVVGVKAGGEKDFTITFPKDYFSKDLAGAKVDFHIKLHEVNEVVMPELNDALAKKLGGFKNLDELKADITRHLQEGKDEQAKKDFREAALQAIIDKTEVNVSESLIENQVEALRNEMNHQLSHEGIDEAKYLELNNKQKADYDKELRNESERRIRLGLILRSIIDKQKITASESEIDDQLNLMRQQYSDPGAVSEMNRPEFRQDLASRILSEKAIDYIMSQVMKGESK